MNQLKQVWNNINSKVDVIFWLNLILFLAVLVLPVKIITTPTSTINPQIFIPKPRKYNPPEKIIAEKPLKIELPVKYKKIAENNFFRNPDLVKRKSSSGEIIDIIPAVITMAADTEETGETISVFKENREFISGYTLLGIIASSRGGEGAALIETPNGETRKVRTGKKIWGTRIRLKQAWPGKALLAAPGYRDTFIYLDQQNILEKWLDAPPEKFTEE